MKKAGAFLLAALMLLTIIPLGAISVSAATCQALAYTINNGEVTITDYDSSASGDLVIPSTIEGYPVTTIGHSAFSSCDSLTSVTIPDSVTSIGSFAFSSCESLMSVTIPDKVTSIGGGAFWGCASLTSMTIPNNVPCIEAYVFEGCTGLTTMTISDSITSIGRNAFYGCSSLISITIPDSVTSINHRAFEGCSNLIEVWYAGNNVNDISIDYSNTSLINAEWHCNIQIENGHPYDNACDTNCNICNVIRDVGPHAYDSSCDTACNSCGFEREADPHTFDNTCDVQCNNCGQARTTPDHVYDHDCDINCNVCSAIREITHTYDNDYDDKCNVCGHTREIVYDFITTTDENITLQYSGSLNFEFVVLDNSIATIKSISTSFVVVDGYMQKITSATIAPLKPGYTLVQAISSSGAVLTEKVLRIEEGAHQMQFSETLATSTCTEQGSELHTCKFCSYQEKIIIDSNGHKYDNACDTTCNECGATRSTSHSYAKKITKATLTKDGVIKNVCTECGYTASKTTAIYKASKISLSKTSYAYTGGVKKPTVVVKDSKGKTISSKYYTVTYASGRKNVGTYKVTVKFKGNYSGTKTLTFKIIPTKTTLGTLTAAKKALTVKWTKKSTQVTGYEVQYGTSKSFKSYKSKIISKNSTTSVKLTGLKAKTTYYVRVRTYKTVNGVKYYSGWSTIKYKKTK